MLIYVTDVYICYILIFLFMSLYRTGSWDAGSPRMILHKTSETMETPDAGYHGYRNCDSDIPSSGYQGNYRWANITVVEFIIIPCNLFTIILPSFKKELLPFH